MGDLSKAKNIKIIEMGNTSSAIKIYNNQLADELMLINISEKNEEAEIF